MECYQQGYQEKRTKKKPATPAALNDHRGWTVLNDNQFDGISFNYQSTFVDEVLTDRAINYVQHFCHRLTDKLIVNLLEPTPVNVFNLLTSSAIECVIEYTNDVTISIQPPSLIRAKGGDIRVALVLTLVLTKLRANRLLNIDLTYFM